MIRKTAGGYKLLSTKKNAAGKRRNLGTSPTLAGIKKREQQVEYFKHKK